MIENQHLYAHLNINLNLNHISAGSKYLKKQKDYYEKDTIKRAIKCY